MDEESQTKGGRINVLNNSSGDDDKVKRNADGIEYEDVEIWSEKRQCNICSLAQKRSRGEAEAGVAERMMSKTDPQWHLATRNQQRERRARVEASGLVAHAGCAEGHTSRERAPTWEKVDRRIPSPPRGLRGDQEVFPGPTPAQWNSWLPKPYKGKGKGKSKGKGKGGKGDKGKGKGQLSGLGEYPPWGPPGGHMPYWDENCVPRCAT